MIIKPTQIQTLSDAQELRFIHETVARLKETEPAWAAGKSDGELCVQIEDAVQLAAAARIRKRDAVVCVIEALVRHRPSFPLALELHNVLCQPNVPEAARAEQFYSSLASGRYLLQEIDLAF
jgi:hypothetical protein